MHVHVLLLFLLQSVSAFIPGASLLDMTETKAATSAIRLKAKTGAGFAGIVKEKKKTDEAVDEVSWLWRTIFDEREDILASTDSDQYVDDKDDDDDTHLGPEDEYDSKWESDQDYVALLQSLLSEAQVVRDLPKQPPMPWDVDKCLGRDAVVPKEDYQIRSYRDDSQIQVLSTPGGAFGIIPGSDRKLTFWTPWISGHPGLGLGEEDLNRQDPQWEHLQRGECCGLDAMLKPKTEYDGKIRLQIKCLGATKGQACHLKKPTKACRAGYKCKESKVEGVGECQPA